MNNNNNKNTNLKNFEKIFNNTLRKNIKSIQKEFDKMRLLADLLDESGLEFKDEEDKGQFFYILELLKGVDRAFVGLDVTNYFHTKKKIQKYILNTIN